MSILSGTSGRGLDFFSSCDVSCNRLLRLLAERSAQGSWRSLCRLFRHDLAALHELPLQTMNDRLKKFPFVDPAPFDELLTEIVDALFDWLNSMTKPYWLTEAVEQLVALSGSHDAGEDDIELLARFEYLIPLKLRELQAMVRPFLEVHSIHHVDGVDAMVSEIVRGLLRLHHVVKIWDAALIRQLHAVANAGFGARGFEGRVAALAGLCATAEMSAFEVSHKLRRISPDVFKMTAREVDAVCGMLPDLEQERLFNGSPTLALDHGATPKFGDTDVQGLAAVPGLRELRAEALQWWWHQGFSTAVPSRIVAASFLQHLQQHQLHPDPWVAENLPRVLERVFGIQMLCDTFMNSFLLKLGGYVTAGNLEIQKGQGLPILTDVTRTAESLLLFLRQWADLAQALEEEAAWAEEASFTRKTVKRASKFKINTFLETMTESGHSVHDVLDLLEGARPIPDHVLTVQASERRYRIDNDMLHKWELLTERNEVLLEQLRKSDRDQGPYVDLDIEDEEQLKAAWRGLYRQDAWCLDNADIYRAAKESYFITESDSEEEAAIELGVHDDVSDFFGFRLVHAPEELMSSSCPSVLMQFLRGEHAITSRRSLPGLPALPWCIGSDPRNTLVFDLQGSAVAPFHCIVKQSKAQEKKVCIVPLHGDGGDSCVVLPKYQALQVYDGYCFKCNNWLFELRLEFSFETKSSKMVIMSEDGTSFESPPTGCHLGVGQVSRPRPYQPAFQPAKMVLTERTENMAEVHLAFRYDEPMDRWTVVNHCPDPHGALLLLKTGVSYPLSRGLRLMLGPLLLECDYDEPPEED